MTDTLPAVPAGPTATPRRARHTLPDFTPVPRLKDRSNGWRPEVQRAFIEALADTGSVRAACRVVGRSEHGAYQMRRHPEGASFREAWEAALDIGIQRIEDIAMDRALNGVEAPVYSYGKLVGTRRIYNDRLLMFLLRNRAPGRFAASGGGAGGRGRGGNGSGGVLKVVEERKMRRLKKLWFEEWQAEQLAKTPSAADIRASINRKIAEVKQRIKANTSPRALDLDLVAQAQRCADHAAGWKPGLDYEPYAAAASELLPQFIEHLTSASSGTEQDAPRDAAAQAATPPLLTGPAPEEEREPTITETRAMIARMLWERRAQLRAQRQEQEQAQAQGGREESSHR